MLFCLSSEMLQCGAAKYNLVYTRMYVYIVLLFYILYAVHTYVYGSSWWTVLKV